MELHYDLPDDEEACVDANLCELADDCETEAASCLATLLYLEMLILMRVRCMLLSVQLRWQMGFEL
jgi:hypothetical protein